MWTHEFLEAIARKRKLTEEQKVVFLAKLLSADRSDIQIAAELHISPHAVRNRWTGIYEKFGIKGKGTGKYGRLLDLLTREHEKFKPSTAEVSDNALKVTISKPDPNFVGRESAIAHLNTFINQGAKVILIHAKGGVGKTTLARKYLQQQFSSYIEFPIAKEAQNITSVESLIEERLKQLGEEPGREFGVSLDRLKRKLQTERIGVLIDNLEPALDGNGKIIEPHRRYVELLRILANPEVQSVTLITSRECLHESAITVRHYLLEGLDVAAWEEFFNSRNLQTDTLALSAMHKAYGGNAKAMEILSSAIQQDYGGNLETYWQASQGDLLLERDLEDLVVCQFNRLQQLNPDAYKLLCRLGCYRYQDVPTVPEEGLFCMLWDVPAAQQRRVVKSLRDRSLVEFCNGEYWLHPMIRAEAIKRLRKSEDWETANRKGADFWSENIKTVETREDVLRALEPYYHYVAIGDFDLAGNVIIKERDSKWGKCDTLYESCYRLGYLQKMLEHINALKSQLNNNAELSGKLYDILGELYWVTGHLSKSLEYCQQSLSISSDYNIHKTKISSSFTIAVCKFYIGETQESLELFEQVSLEAEKISDHEYAAYTWYWLAFLNSYFGFEETASIFAAKSENMPEDLSNAEFGAVGQGFRLFFLGFTYLNLGEHKKSFNFYHSAIEYAKETHFNQIKGMSLTGLAKLYRDNGDFETAFANHSESIELLDKIGAKCDLAEAYYQLGLTYQKMGDTQKGQENFNKAIQLFSEMEAPKQVEKVRQAMDRGE